MSASASDPDCVEAEVVEAEVIEELQEVAFPELPDPGQQEAETPLLPHLLIPIEFPLIAESGVAETEGSIEVEDREFVSVSPVEELADEELTDTFEDGSVLEFIAMASLGDSLPVDSAVASTTQDDSTDMGTSALPTPYSQHIVLNNQDNDAILEDNGDSGDGLVQIRSTNGTFETIVFQLPTDQLIIELGDGNDSLLINARELETFSASLFLYGQAGNDSINLDTVQTTGSVFIDDADGDNQFLSRRLDIAGDLFISDGDGEQSASVVGMIQGDVTIVSTDGGSSINLGLASIESTVIEGSVSIDNAGSGSDAVRLSGRINGDFYIAANDGDFELRSIFSSVRGSLFTDVGDGDSTIFLGDFDAGERSYFNTQSGNTDTWLTASFFLDDLIINNGDGFDRLRLDGSRISSNGNPGTLTVNNGDGGSSTSLNENQRIFRLSIGELRLLNGTGDDAIDVNLRDGDFLGSIYADNGSGNTTTNIAGTGALDSATFISGDGDDTITIDGVDIQNALTINSGAGQRTVDVQNSVVGNTQIDGAGAVQTDFGNGDDEIFASLGNNIIDGGDGDDVLVVYEGTSADFSIRFEDDGRVIVEGPGLNGTTVRNELINVERIRFNDREVFLTDDAGTEPETIQGTDGDDWIAVSERGGNVEAGAGDDAIYAPFSESFNQIDGGTGIDTLVVYEGVRADYTFRQITDDSQLEIEGPGLNGNIVVNRLIDMEFIQFNDERIAVADIAFSS